MNRKTVSGIMLTLLLVGTSTLAFNIQQATAGGTIYIASDYTFTHDIYEPIVVLADNIVIDGNGYTLQGTGAYDSTGIYLPSASNVTIKDTNIKGFYYGVNFKWAHYNILSANNITNNVYGVQLYFSLNNTLYGNSIEANERYGLYLYESSNNTVSGNDITATYGYTDSKGVLMRKSSNNVIDGNMVTKNDGGGIVLSGSSNNIISANNIANNGYWLDDFGIDLTYCSIWDGCYPTSYSDNNTIIGNNVTKNTSGIRLRASWYNTLNANIVTNNGGKGVHMETASQNILRDNILAGNKYNFGVFTFYDEVRLSTYTQDIDTSNTVDGKPIYYMINQNGLIVDSSDIGYLALVNCTNIHTKDMTLTNNGQGLLLAFTVNSTIENATIVNNRVGIHALSSDANTITASNITNNSIGVSLYRASFNNITENILTNNGISIGTLIMGQGSLYTTKSIPSEDNVISSNTMSGGGISFKNSGTTRTIVTDNTIKNGGISLGWGTSNNKIYHNNFIDNKVYIDTEHGAVVNIWDDGYPSGGNYWSDYSGVDEFNGPGQNISGSDGIGDTPYDIDFQNKDDYPLMEPWMPPGMVADLVRRRAWSEHHHCDISKDEDEYQTLYAKVRNLGNQTVWVKAVFNITKDDGFSTVVESEPLLVETDTIVELSADFGPLTNADAGKYYVSATCWYSQDKMVWRQGEKEKAFKFNVVL